MRAGGGAAPVALGRVRAWSWRPCSGRFGLAACSSNGDEPDADQRGHHLDGELLEHVDLLHHDVVGPGRDGVRGPRPRRSVVVGSQGAAGTFELTFALRNSSTSPCPMDGYPSAQLLDASGTELPTHVVSGGNYQFTNFAPAPVLLAPGATAYFNLAYSDVPTGGETTCPTAAQIEVTPPHAVDHDVVTGAADGVRGGDAHRLARVRPGLAGVPDHGTAPALLTPGAGPPARR